MKLFTRLDRAITAFFAPIEPPVEPIRWFIPDEHAAQVVHAYCDWQRAASSAPCNAAMYRYALGKMVMDLVPTRATPCHYELDMTHMWRPSVVITQLTPEAKARMDREEEFAKKVKTDAAAIPTNPAAEPSRTAPLPHEALPDEGGRPFSNSGVPVT